MKILVIQLRRIGDILLTTSVLRYLKETVDSCEIDFLCEPCGKEVLETNPRIRNLFIYDKKHPWLEIKRVRQQSYDVVFDFMNNPRTALLAGLSGAKETVGYKTRFRSIFYSMAVPIPFEPEYVPLRKIRLVKEWLEAKGMSHPAPAHFMPELALGLEEKKFADDWIASEKLAGAPFVVLVPAHRHSIRQWRSDGFREVGLRLLKENFRVFLAWGPGEEKVMHEVQQGDSGTLKMLPPTRLRQMAAIFKQAKLVVTNDSGAMHLSVSVGTPTVTVYGPTRPIDWNPSLADAMVPHRALSADGVDCLGCHLSNCSVGHICMKQLEAGNVAETALQLLKREKTHV